MNRFRKWGLLLLAIAAVGYFTLVLLTPQFGRIEGYADQQPGLTIRPPANTAQAEHIRQLATLHLDYRPEIRQFYWPEPSMIEEHDECWLVVFTAKVPIYRWLGFTEKVPPSDQVMFMTIEKADETTRLGRWCPKVKP